MINRHRQKGLSSISWVILASIFGFLILSFFRVFPMYYENFQIRSILNSIQEDPSIDVKSKRAIWSTLQNRFNIDDVDSIKREHVKLSRKNSKTTIKIDYERRKPLIANLFIGAKFSETLVIDR